MADTVNLMRKRVLNMAIRGELVEQRIEEGTAEGLLKFVKQNKITKNQDTAFEVDNKDIPFIIPKNWKWIKLGSIFNITSSKRITKSQWSDYGVPFYRARDIVALRNNSFVDSLNIPFELFEEIKEKYGVPKRNDLMVTGVGSIGVPYIVKKDEEFYFKDATILWFKNILNINVEYIYYLFESDFLRERILSESQGTTVATYTITRANNELIPLPPLPEQKRIVAKIEEIFAVIDQIGTKKEEALSIIQNMRQTALQDAIRGVLVEQDENDEPASILYEKIQVEKEKLVKEKKIKKEKPLPNIEDDEIPFDIPESWKWVRLKEVVHNHGQKKPDKPFSYIDIGSIDNNRTQLNKEDKIVKPEEAPSRARKIVKFGDILYSTVRPYLHNACIVDREFSEEPIASTGFAVMRTFNGLLNRFLFYYLLSPTFDLYANDSSNATGTAYPAINDTKLYRAVVPLPPLAEQERIAEKIDEIMAICDQMEAIFDGSSEMNTNLKVV
ncbi:restriction endonuclease subunit S [Aerococcus urinaeequi]|uniref:restriction endonuclease subunit S n=1 Tax=Aerococcus urinaeequi TaxID=51665 RepID=UPI003D6B5883